MHNAYAARGRAWFALALLSGLLSAGCDRGSSSPTAPSDPAAPQAARAVTLEGVVVKADADTPIAGALVSVSDGTNSAKSGVTSDTGYFQFADLQAGTLAVRVTAQGYDAASQEVPLSTDSTIKVPLHQSGTPAPSPAPSPTPSPTPAPAPQPAPTAGPVVKGETVDGISSGAVAGAAVRADAGTTAFSRTDGTFDLPVTGQPSLIRVTISSTATIDRTTHVEVNSEPAVLTLIPQRLNLAAFDQMFRAQDGLLRRWVSPPRLVIQRRVLQFTTKDASTAIGTSVAMTAQEAAAIQADMTWALPQLTGETFSQFAGVTVELAGDGETVDLNRPDTIVVARFEGLTSATSYWGYTRWAWDGTGRVQAAILMLDRAFDASTDPHIRSLRSHELGHALGYNHVDACTSVMNASGRIEPTPFDRDGGRIAFLRPPLNRSPDVDPDPATATRLTRGALVWQGAH